MTRLWAIRFFSILITLVNAAILTLTTRSTIIEYYILTVVLLILVGIFVILPFQIFKKFRNKISRYCIYATVQMLFFLNQFIAYLYVIYTYSPEGAFAK